MTLSPMATHARGLKAAVYQRARPEHGLPPPERDLHLAVDRPLRLLHQPAPLRRRALALVRARAEEEAGVA